MRHFARIALASSLLLTVTACAQPATAPAPVGTTAVQPAASKAASARQTVAALLAETAAPLVKDLGNADGASVAVSFQLPTAQRAVQALQHRWLVGDIKSYLVSLQVKGASGTYVEIASLSINATSHNTSTAAPKALAAFTGLEANKEYKVTVQAWGSNATTAATAANQQLNAQTPAVALFDFREDGNANIENTPPAQNLAIVLDSFVFDGKATINTQVTEGTFLSAPGGVKAKAVTPPPSATNGVGWGAWGWDIVGLTAHNVDMTPLLANDGNLYTPTHVRWVPMDGDGHQIHLGGYWFDLTTLTSHSEFWYLGGQFTPHGIHTYGFKATYEGPNGVYAESPIQATTYINW